MYPSIWNSRGVIASGQACCSVLICGVERWITRGFRFVVWKDGSQEDSGQWGGLSPCHSCMNFGFWEAGKRERHHQKLYCSTFAKDDFRQCCVQLRGRRARWLQLPLSNASLRYAALLDVAELINDGYPIVVLRRLWLAQKKDGVDKAFALQCLASL